jgi:adenylosuccinate lyase
MVPRYSRPAMTAIWAPENRYRIWFRMPWPSSARSPPNPPA